MRKFIIRFVLLLILPLLAIAFAYEGLARRIPNDYSYKHKWMNHNASSVKILNLGSSHGYFGIDPSVFSEKAFNCAHESQGLKYDHFLFSKYYGKMDSLEVLILPVSYRSFFETGIEQSQEPWREKYYGIYYHCPYHAFSLRNHSEFYNDLIYRSLSFYKLFKSLYTDRFSYVHCDSLGKGTRTVYDNGDIDWWENNGKMRAASHTLDINHVVIERNMDYVADIAEKCDQKGVHVIMVTIPTYHSYYDNLDEKHLTLMEDCCHLILDESVNVSYLNLLTDDRFGISDFGDSDHLNESGARKLSLILSAYCDSLRGR